MRCRTAQRWLLTAPLAERPPRRTARLERHLERCEGCRRERAAYAALDRVLGALPTEAAVPPRLEQDTLRRVRLAAAEEEAPSAPGLGRWLGIGVPALAGAAVLAVAVRMARPPEAPGPPSAPAQERAVASEPRTEAPPTQVAKRQAPPAPAAQARRRQRPQPAVPSEPPPELAARPDLFVNLPILRNMEKLQHFEAIETTTLDRQGDEQSNG